MRSASDPPAAEPATPGQLVRAARLRARLTQEQLARRANKHVNTIAKLEDDTTPPRLTARGWRTVEDVARALQTTPEALGYQAKKSLSTRNLTAEQRELLEEIVALPAEDVDAIRAMLRTLHEQRGRKGRKK